MAVIDPTTLRVGQTVAFKCNHTTDTLVYEGVIVGICLYSEAKVQQDILPYYQEVKKMQQDMLAIDKLTYLVLQIFQNGMTTKVVRAVEWIIPSTLKLVVNDTSFTIRVYNTAVSHTDEVLELLQSHGFPSVLVSISE